MGQAHPTQVGRYRLLRLLGRGGQASVWEAQLAPDGPRVALKRLHPEVVLLQPQMVARLEREARLLAGAGIPGVVRLLDAGLADGAPFLVYELLEGARPLDQAFAGLALPERLALVREAARAVGALHARGIVHRDVSPGNLLVDAAGRVRVTDLGLAAGEQAGALTRTGEVLGTAGWLAPEVALAGSRDGASPAADVWSLGALLFLALTGAHPFAGLGAAQTLQQLQRAGPPAPASLASGIPEALDRLCRRALALDPTVRPPDGEALARELEQLPGASPPAAPPAAGRRLGRWTLLRLLGAGGMGQVFLARDEQLGREVALKVLPGGGGPARRERFQREITAAARARHPALVSVHEAGEADGVAFLVMDVVQGEALNQVLGRGPLPVRDAVRLVRELVGAVRALHEAGVLHRDIKPHNVLLQPDGSPRLVDLGVALLRDEERLTRTGQLVGTPVYMAPELFARGEPDGRADVYGLGAVLFEALTGEPPHPGGTLGELMAAKQRPPRSPRQLRPELDPGLEALCLEALEPLPARRVASAAELEERLGAWLEGRGAGGRPRRPVRRVPAAIGGVALLLVGAALWPGREPGPDLPALRRELEARGRACVSLEALELDPALPAALEASNAAPEAGRDVARLWVWWGLVRLARGEPEAAAEAASRAGDLGDPALDLLRGGLLAQAHPGDALAALDRAERGGLVPRELHTWRLTAWLARGILDRPAAEGALEALARAGAAGDGPTGRLVRLSALRALGRLDEAAALRPLLDPAGLTPGERWELALLDAEGHLQAERWAEAQALLEAIPRPPGSPGARAAALAARAEERATAALEGCLHARRAPSVADGERVGQALRVHLAAVGPPPQALCKLAAEVIWISRLAGESRPRLALEVARVWPDDPDALAVAAAHLRGFRFYDQETPEKAELVRGLLETVPGALAHSPPERRAAMRSLNIRGLVCSRRWEEAEREGRAMLAELPPGARDEAGTMIEADVLLLLAVAVREQGRIAEAQALFERLARLPVLMDGEDEIRLERLRTALAAGDEAALAEARRFLDELERGVLRGDRDRPAECAWLAFVRGQSWGDGGRLAALMTERAAWPWSARRAMVLAGQKDLPGASEALERALAATGRKGKPQLSQLVALQGRLRAGDRGAVEELGGALRAIDHDVRRMLYPWLLRHE